MPQTVLITGTSSGIGEAAAKLFLSEGWNVVATARRPEALGEWSRSDRAAAVRMDVTDDASIRDAVADALVRFGRIDVLVNNAGIGLAGPLEGIAREQLQQQFDTNFFGLVATTRAVLPHMRENKWGLIINVTSITGRLGLPFLSPYNACKFAAEGLTESLHFELRPFGIRVKLVEPGGVKTKFSHEWATHPAYEPSLSAVQAKMTAGAAKAAEPEAVAKVILKATQDGSGRLRYTATDGGALLALHKLMPEGLWRSFVAKTFKASAAPRDSTGLDA